MEIHYQSRGCAPTDRPFNDLDFVTSGFDCIPTSLADDYLRNHIHPLDPPGKTILQLIDSNTSIRVDVFRAFGATMSRVNYLELWHLPIFLISLEDLVARAARLASAGFGGRPTRGIEARQRLFTIGGTCGPGTR